MLEHSRPVRVAGRVPQGCAGVCGTRREAGVARGLSSRNLPTLLNLHAGAVALVRLDVAKDALPHHPHMLGVDHTFDNDHTLPVQPLIVGDRLG